MKTITQEFVDFCKRYKIICKTNKKTVVWFLSVKFLQKAGYKKLPLNPIKIIDIYLNLHEASVENNIQSEHPDYLSVKNIDIMNSVVYKVSKGSKGSKDLKKFLQKNGYPIIEVPRQKKLKDTVDIEKKSLTDTIRMFR